MNSENKILKIVWDKGSKAPIQLIAREAGFGIDYTRYILGHLLKDKLIAPLSGKDAFKITSKGKRRLGFMSTQKRPARKKYSIAKERKPVLRRHAVSKEVEGVVLVRSEDPAKVVLAHNLHQNSEEKKMNIWGAIKKAASFLSELPQEDEPPKKQR